MNEGTKKPTLTKEAMINNVVGELLAQTKEKYKIRVYSPTRGLKIPIMIKSDKTVEILEENDFLQVLKIRAKKLYESASITYKKADMLLLAYDTAKQLMKTILIHQDMQLKEEIKTFAFKSEDCLTFCRIPFDVSHETMPCPKWDRLLDNFSNIQALKIWIGSLFVWDSDRSQYVWIYGKGGNGKSTLARVISSILGHFVRFEQVPSRDDKYWTFGLLGKRLIVLDDCNNYGFIKTGLFKSLTGSSKVRVEQKFGHPYDTDIDCKFLFTSNEKPMVSNEIADQRRLIFCAAKNNETFDFDANFINDLKQELPNFISNCVLLYNEHCLDGRPIPVDQAEALELGEIYNEEIEAWIDTNFEYDPTSWIEVSKFRSELKFTKLNDRRVYAFLEQKNVTRKLKKVNGVVFKAIFGLRQKVVHFYRQEK